MQAATVGDGLHRRRDVEDARAGSLAECVDCDAIDERVDRRTRGIQRLEEAVGPSSLLQALLGYYLVRLQQATEKTTDTPRTHEENSREELRNELAAITEEIEEWQAAYDVETWEDLEQSLANGDLTSAELRDRRDVITRWEENQEDRRLIKHALALYSDVEAARDQMNDVADRTML